MKYFVINLDRSLERRKIFFEINKGAEKVERFRAIDGLDLDVTELERSGMIEKAAPNNRPSAALGNALSHRKLMECCIAMGEPVTVFEDDAILNDYFFLYSERVLQTLPESWEFIAWGWNFDTVMQFYLPGSYSPCVTFYDQEELGKNVSLFQKQNTFPTIYKVHTLLGIMAYSVHPRGAERILKHCFPLVEKLYYIPGLKRHVISYGMDILLNEYFQTSASFVCFPPLAVSRNQESTIWNSVPK